MSTFQYPCGTSFRAFTSYALILILSILQKCVANSPSKWRTSSCVLLVYPKIICSSTVGIPSATSWTITVSAAQEESVWVVDFLSNGLSGGNMLTFMWTTVSAVLSTNPQSGQLSNVLDERMNGFLSFL